MSNRKRAVNKTARLRIGRGGGIRTHDPLVPNQMRYQAALRPERWDDTPMQDSGQIICYKKREYLLATPVGKLR
jgi:hypothetical protein